MNQTIFEAPGLFFIGESKDKKVASLYYEIEEGIFILNSVKVDVALRNHGIAARLVEYAVEYARKHSLAIDPVCSYAQDQFEKYPEYSDVLYQRD